jgi:hypothetical protein
MKRVKITEESAYGKALERLTGGPRTAPPESDSKQAAVSEKAAEITGPTTIKLSVFLNRQEDAYLESLSSAAKFSGGKKISKTKLVENMVKAFSTTELDMRGVKGDDEILSRLMAQLRK